MNSNQNKIFKTLRSWQKQIVKAKSVKSKMCKMHDIIIKKTSYDYSITDLNNDDVDMSQSICGVFLDKSAICYGYAATFSMLCNYNNIKNNILMSDRHTWNRVYYNKSWKYVDCTWNDLDMGEFQTWDYFLISRSKALKADEQDEHVVSEWLKQCVK